MKKLGFTLAEVLITLVIIGVIAAMTVPTLMNNTNGQEYRTGFKKAISALNQALTMSYAVDGYTAQDFTTAKDLVDYVFKTKMNTLDSVSGQFTNTGLCDGAVFTTSDGIMYCITNFASVSSDEADTGQICDSYNLYPCASNANTPNIWIDVNGSKKPNLQTKSASNPRDIYQAMLYAQKVIPFGTASQGVMMDEGTGSIVKKES